MVMFCHRFESAFNPAGAVTGSAGIAIARIQLREYRYSGTRSTAATAPDTSRTYASSARPDTAPPSDPRPSPRSPRSPSPPRAARCRPRPSPPASRSRNCPPHHAAPVPAVPVSPFPPGEKIEFALHRPVHLAASRRRAPLRRRARHIHALVHIDRQIVQPRVAQNVRRVRPARQHVLPRKSHQRRNLLAQPSNRLPMPAQRPRLARSLRESSAPRRAHWHNSAPPAARSCRPSPRRTPRRTPSRCAPPAALRWSANPSPARRSDS